MKCSLCSRQPTLAMDSAELYRRHVFVSDDRSRAVCRECLTELVNEATVVVRGIEIEEEG